MRLLIPNSRAFSWLKPGHLVLFGAILGAVGILSVFALSGTAYASGGVGSGGGGGGSGTGNYTYYGWGWAIYDIGTPGNPGSGIDGPHDGFRMGGPWSAVLSECQSANASQVYAFDIDDSSGNSKVYNYETIEGGPPTYADSFAPGTTVDNGRATAISISAADMAFNSLPTYGVNTSGYIFGSNVAWFCYDYAPSVQQPPPPAITATCSASGIITGSDSNYPNDSPPITITLTTGGVNNGQHWPTPPSTEHVVGIAATLDGHGYWEVTNQGGVFAFGDATYYGNSPAGNTIVGIAAYPGGGGYWLVSNTGAVFSENGTPGGGPYYGNSPAGNTIVGIAAYPGGGGYWLVSNTGAVFSENGTPGGGPYYGNSPAGNTIVGIAAYPGGGGYWLVSNTGAVFSENGTPGGGPYYGNSPAGNTIVGIAAYPGGGGYWLVSNTGAVFSENGTPGGGPYYGGSPPHVTNIVGIASDPTGGGYTLVGSDGGIFNYGTGFYGSAQPDLVATDVLSAGSGSSSFTFDASSYTSPNNNTVFSITATSSSSPSQSDTISVTCPVVPSSQVTITCDAASATPTTVGVDQPFSYTASVKYHWPYSGTSSVSGYVVVTITGGPNISIGSSGSPITAHSSPWTGTQNNNRIGSVGSYSTKYTFYPTSPTTTTNNATNCPGPTINVVDEPYFQVNGSDTSVGSGFCINKSSLPPSYPKASIYSWNSPTYGTHYNEGAGDQFGVFASYLISGYASAEGLPNGTSPLGLSFANTNNTSSPDPSYIDTVSTNNFGGGFNSSDCNYDYYSDRPSDASLLPSSTTSITGLSSGSYYIDSPSTTVKLGGNTAWGNTPGALGNRVILYVKGNVEIDGDITYSGQPSAGNFTSADQIPLFELIVQGNITIDNSVGEVDGIYIAEPSSSMVPATDGIISTCESNPSTTASSCDNPLVVNGALDANSFNLWRTSGSAGDGSVDPAETINYSPWVWLSQEPSTSTTSTNVNSKTDSISNLPPIL